MAAVLVVERHSASSIDTSEAGLTQKFLQKRKIKSVNSNKAYLIKYYFFRGATEVLRKRLKNYYKRIKLGDSEIEGQYYPFFIVVDFEATCEEPNPEDYLHEIIEFPAVLIESATYTIVRFQIVLLAMFPIAAPYVLC